MHHRDPAVALGELEPLVSALPVRQLLRDLLVDSEQVRAVQLGVLAPDEENLEAGNGQARQYSVPAQCFRFAAPGRTAVEHVRGCGGV